MIILNTSQTNATSDEVVIPFQSDRGALKPIQVFISNTANVKLQAKVDEDMNWVDVASFTETAIKLIGLPKRVRAVVSLNTGTVKVAVDG